MLTGTESSFSVKEVRKQLRYDITYQKTYKRVERLGEYPRVNHSVVFDSHRQIVDYQHLDHAGYNAQRDEKHQLQQSSFLFLGFFDDRLLVTEIYRRSLFRDFAIRFLFSHNFLLSG